jgi:hypothetical protein
MHNHLVEPGVEGRKVTSQVVRLRAKRKEARESRQRHCKSAGQEEAGELRQEEARESHHILPGVLKSVKEYEGVNPHTPKATPILGDGVATPLWPSVGVKPNTWKNWRFGVPRDSQMFRARQQGPKHLTLRHS